MKRKPATPEPVLHLIREARAHNDRLKLVRAPTGDDYNFLLSLIEGAAFTLGE